MSTNYPTVENLQEIKNVLEQKINEPSDSESSSYESDSESYKLKYNKLESKIHYMQLEMVNKDLEIAEYKNKLNIYTKNDLLFTKINFLFDRLDNAYKILKEKVNIINDKDYIKFKTITELTSIKESIIKVRDKYKLYVDKDIYPLITDSHVYFKNAITALYNIKENEFISLSTTIDIKIFNTKYNNTCWASFFIMSILLILQIIIFGGYYMFIK
jgi:hypothetical protein